MNTISLKLLCTNEYLPVVLSFAEETSKAFGLKNKEIFAIRLSVEEIFSYLSKIFQGKIIEIICKNSGYSIELTFLFKGKISLKVFNITSSVSIEKEKDLEEMGLLIVSRLVDNFKILKNQDGSISLVLVKDKIYPELKHETEEIGFEKSTSFNIKKPNNEEIKIFVSFVKYFYNNKLLPDFFKFPGKVVDMINYSDYEILIAKDEKNQTVGGILWHWSSPKLIEFFGPFIFKDDFTDSVKDKLIIKFLEAVGKSDAIGIYSQLSVEKLPLEYFEIIGELPFYNNENIETLIPVYFRQLKEDSGAVSWCSESLKQFLEKFYQTLFLPRKIETVVGMGESMSEYSVLSTNFYKFQKTVVLKIIMSGRDLSENIGAHLQLLKKESFKNIYFEIDLGIPEQAYAVDSLLNNGLKPKILIPCAGNGDIVVFYLESK